MVGKRFRGLSWLGMGCDVCEHKSSHEVAEATKRWGETAAWKRQRMTAEFRQTDELGIKTPLPVLADEAPFQVVSCMFAFHYFFSELMVLKRFLQTVRMYATCDALHSSPRTARCVRVCAAMHVVQLIFPAAAGIGQLG